MVTSRYFFLNSIFCSFDNAILLLQTIYTEVDSVEVLVFA